MINIKNLSRKAHLSQRRVSALPRSNASVSRSRQQTCLSEQRECLSPLSRLGLAETFPANKVNSTT